MSDDHKNLVRIRRVYDDFRTVEMNRTYYACKLARLKRANLVYEVMLAIGASGTVGGWYVWKTESGKIAWAVFAGFVAVLAIVKPILQLSKEIERYSKIYTGYTDLYYDIRSLIDGVEAYGHLSNEADADVEKALKRYRDLALQDDPKPSARLLERSYRDVEEKHEAFDDWLRKIKRR